MEEHEHEELRKIVEMIQFSAGHADAQGVAEKISELKKFMLKVWGKEIDNL